MASVRAVQDVQIATRASWSQYQYTLVAATNETVRRWALQLMARMREDATFANVTAVEEDEGLEARIEVDRIRAGQFGVSLQSVSDLLNDAFSQRQVSTIYGQSNQYRVAGGGAALRTEPGALQALRVPAAGGQSSGQSAQVPFASFATIARGSAPLAVSRQEQFPAFTIAFDLGPDRSLEEAVARIGALEREIGLPPSVSGGFASEAAEFRASLANQPWLILAAVIAIYIVLGVLYESYIHPITILSTLPSAGIGALLALMAVGEHLTIIGVVAIVLLMASSRRTRSS